MTGCEAGSCTVGRDIVVEVSTSDSNVTDEAREVLIKLDRDKVCDLERQSHNEGELKTMCRHGQLSTAAPVFLLSPI